MPEVQARSNVLEGHEGKSFAPEERLRFGPTTQESMSMATKEYDPAKATLTFGGHKLSGPGMTEPNRYGCQDNRNEDGELCCCHMRPLTATCDGCFALEGTKRQPTLVGVDPCRMNPLNDDGAEDDVAPPDRLHPGVERALEDTDTLDAADTRELEDNDDFAEDLDSQDSPPDEGC